MCSPPASCAEAKARRRFGANGPHLAPLTFGTNAIGRMGERPALALLEAAYAGGVRAFDTAPAYGAGAAEIRLRRALQGVPRTAYTLASKTGYRVPKGGGAPVLDYSREGTVRAVDECLTRLGTDRLDLAFVHDIDPWTHGAALSGLLRTVLTEALPALARLREEGAVGAIGVAINSTRVAERVIAEADIDGIQIAGRATLLDQAALVDLVPLARRTGLGLIAAAPLASGILADDTGDKTFFHAPAPPTIAARHRALAACAARHGVSLMAAALAFPCRTAEIASVVAGARSPEQLAGLLAAHREAVPDAFFGAIEDAGLIVGADPLVREIVGEEAPCPPSS